MSSIPNPIRILIADDHPSTREGLRAMLERNRNMKVVAEASNGEEAVALFREHQPDVVLMDLQMPRMDGVQAITAIHAYRPKAPIVVLTTYPGDARVSRALSAGALAYILKTADRACVFRAIFAAVRGKSVLDDTLASDMAANVAMEALTEKEITVLRLVAAGKQDNEIGQALNVTQHAIKSRLKNILSKLGASNRTHAVSIARTRGIIDD